MPPLRAVAELDETPFSDDRAPRPPFYHSHLHHLLCENGYRVWYDANEMGFDLVRHAFEGEGEREEREREREREGEGRKRGERVCVGQSAC